VQEVAPEALAYIPDLQQEANWLKWAGLGFNEEETFKLQMSLKVGTRQKLMQTSGAKELRLWGKVSGSQRDYYVAEGQADAPEVTGGEEAEPPADFEAHGSGINTNSYWVADSPMGPWTMLPDVSPKQLNIARQICKLFTGDLEAPVVSNPHFPGKEKELLRCQIARITYGTNLIPTGLYKLNEDDPTQLDAEEEPKIATNRDLTKLEHWVHYQPGVLLCGRLTHMEPEQPEGVEEEIDPEVLKARQLAADPLIPRLKPASQDLPVPGFKTAWVCRWVGDTQAYQQNTQKKEVKEYAYNVLKSLWWPGAVIVHRDGKWLSCYVGDGLKAKLQPVYPVNPPVLQPELPDLTEQPEPTPLHAPPAPEAEEAADKDQAEDGEEES